MSNSLGPEPAFSANSRHRLVRLLLTRERNTARTAHLPDDETTPRPPRPPRPAWPATPVTPSTHEATDIKEQT